MPELHPRVRLNRLSANVWLGFALILCFARCGGCVQVGFLSNIRAPAGERRIFETSNLDACVMAPGPPAAHKPLARLTKQLDQRVPREREPFASDCVVMRRKCTSPVQFVHAVRNTIQGHLAVVRLIVKGDFNAVGRVNEHSNVDVSRLRNLEFGRS